MFKVVLPLILLSPLFLLNFYFMERTKEKKVFDKNELEVTFYIYQSENIELLWQKCYLNNPSIKKRGAFHFHEQLKHHKWRVHDPEKASIFIVPFFMMMESVRIKNCDSEQHICPDFSKLIHPVVEEIKQSKYYKRSEGKDHLFVDPWWRFQEIADLMKINDFTDTLILGMYGVHKPYISKNYIGALKKRCGLYVPMDPNYPEIEGNPKPINKRDIDFFFMGGIDKYKPDRKKIFMNFPPIPNKIVKLIDVDDFLNLTSCDFGDSNQNILGNYITDEESIHHSNPSKDFNNIHGYNSRSFSRCRLERSDKFKEWSENSKFCLMIRGQDFLSERLYASIGFGSINLIFSDFLFETGVPFQCFVPWKEFTFQINSTQFIENPLASLEKVIHLNSKQLKKIQKKIIKYRPEVLWNHPESIVAQNVLINAVQKCFPVQKLEEKNLNNFKYYKCPFPDFQDKYTDSIDVSKEIF